MNETRKSLWLAVLILAVFALAPSAALADKSYSDSYTTSAGAGGTTNFVFTFTSTGNSSFNSLTIKVPNNYTVVGNPTISSNKGSASYSSGTVTVTNIGLPVGAGSNEVISVTVPSVSASGGASCSAVQGTWTPTLYGGSQLNGSVFSGTPGPLNSSIPPVCYTVTGVASPAGNGNMVSCASPVPLNGSSVCTESPGTGYTFTSFSANCGAPKTATTCTVSNVQSNQIVTGNFTLITFNIPTTVYPPGSGTISCSPNPVTYNGNFTCMVTSSTANYSFTGFTGGCAGGSFASPSCTTNNVVMSPGTVTGNFMQNSLAITAPSSVVAGNAPENQFTVTVNLTGNPSNANVTLSSDCASSFQAGIVQQASAGVATFSNLSITDAATCNLNATAPNFMSAAVALTAYEGQLDCNKPLDENFTNPNGLANWAAGYATGSRGPYNKDGTGPSCTLIPYTFTNDVLTNAPNPVSGNPPENTVHLTWNRNAQHYAVFTYTVNWSSQSSDSNGWHTSEQPVVAWLNTDGSPASGPGNPAFINALACLGTNPWNNQPNTVPVPTNMPAPYGSLHAGLGPLDTSITIDGVAVDPTTNAPAIPATPFPVVIADSSDANLERMTATMLTMQDPANPPANYNGTFSLTYTVTRGGHTEGNPTPIMPANLPSHSAGQSVVSTPFPIIPDIQYFQNQTLLGYQPWNVAYMCVNENGFFALGNGQVVDFTTFIDGDDGWGGHP